MQRVQEFLNRSVASYRGNIDSGHEEYEVILKSNEYGSAIDRELSVVHKVLKDLYRKRFPELEQIIPSPVDYARIVLLIHAELVNSSFYLVIILLIGPKSRGFIERIDRASDCGSQRGRQLDCWCALD